MAHNPSSSEIPVSLQGQLLLASPALADGTFDYSVIMLAEHSLKQGALGAIINHKSDRRVKDLLPNPEFKALHNLPIYHGGPVSTNELSFSAFSWDKTHGLQYKHRISADMAKKLMEKQNHLIHATVGYSAWTPGQLEEELKRHTWVIAKPTKDIFSNPHDISLWKFILKNMSPFHDLLSEAPQNPFLN